MSFISEETLNVYLIWIADPKPFIIQLDIIKAIIGQTGLNH